MHYQESAQHRSSGGNIDGEDERNCQMVLPISEDIESDAYADRVPCGAHCRSVPADVVLGHVPSPVTQLGHQEQLTDPRRRMRFHADLHDWADAERAVQE